MYFVCLLDLFVFYLFNTSSKTKQKIWMVNVLVLDNTGQYATPLTTVWVIVVLSASQCHLGYFPAAPKRLVTWVFAPKQNWVRMSSFLMLSLSFEMNESAKCSMNSRKIERDMTMLVHKNGYSLMPFTGQSPGYILGWQQALFIRKEGGWYRWMVNITLIIK